MNQPSFLLLSDRMISLGENGEIFGRVRSSATESQNTQQTMEVVVRPSVRRVEGKKGTREGGAAGSHSIGH